MGGFLILPIRFFFFMGGTLKQTVCENTFSWVKKILLEILKQTIGEFFFITGRSFE